VAREKEIILTGNQREDIDPHAVARVLVRLARQWQKEKGRHTQRERPKERA